jgi:hypothetical protein
MNMVTPKQAKLIAALLVARTAREACRQAGVPERTLRAWKQTPEFRAALKDAEGGVLREAAGLLQSMTLPAARVLRRLLHARDPAVRLRAAQTVIDRAVKGAELLDLMERVEQLEAAAKRGGKVTYR